MRKLLIGLFLVGGLWAQEPLVQQARQAFRLGQLEKAASLAEQVLAQAPESVTAHIILGVIGAQGKQWSTARRHFEKVTELAPSDPNGYFYLGQAYFYEQQWAKAANHFAQALERNHADRARLIVQLAFAQNEAGRAREALSTLGKIQAPASGPHAAQYHAVRAYAHAKLNKPDSAVASMRRAREFDRENPAYWEFIVSQLVQSDRLSLAVSESVEAQKKFPDFEGIHYFFGVSSSRLGNIDLARLALRNLLELNPEDPRSLMLQGIVHRQEGRMQEALQVFARAARQDIPDSHLLLGLVLKDSGDLDAAEREFQRAQQHNPKNGQARFELGKLLLARGKLPEARIHLEKAAQYIPRTSSVHYQLANLYRRLGEEQKARQSLATFERLKKQMDRAITDSPAASTK